MAKGKKFKVVLKILQEANGNPVPVEDLRAVLGDVGYRVSSFIWDIKHFAGFDVKTVKNGRRVLAYVLGDPIPPTHGPLAKKVSVSVPSSVRAPASPPEALASEATHAVRASDGDIKSPVNIL